MFDHMLRGFVPPHQDPMTVQNPRVIGLVEAIRAGRAPQNPMVPNAAMRQALARPNEESFARRAELSARPKPAQINNFASRMGAMNDELGRVTMASGARMAPGARQIPPQVRARLMALQRGNPV